jgi:heme O synthase-like polyprenyltransferase
MANGSIGGGQLGQARNRGEGVVQALVLVLAVFVAPVGLLVATALGFVAYRNGQRPKAIRYFIFAAIALVILLFLVLVGLRTSTGGSGGIVHY